MYANAVPFQRRTMLSSTTSIRQLQPSSRRTCPQRQNHRIQRWFEHAKMKEICGRFIKPKLEQPVLDLIGTTAPPDLQNVARSFIDLQEARHSADYDLSYKLSSADAHQLIKVAARAMDSWDRIAASAEANIFVLSLLMWKNWEKDR